MLIIPSHVTGCSRGFESLCIEDGDADPINISEQNGNLFDETIGHIEDVLMGENYFKLHEEALLNELSFEGRM